MESGFGGRQPWINPQSASTGSQPNQQLGAQMPFHPGPSVNNSVMTNQGLPMSNCMINPQYTTSSVSGFPQSAQIMSTPSSASYPLLGLDISNQMFMQAMNFERMLQATGSQQQVIGDTSFRENIINGPLDRSMNDSQRTDASLDLIEQRQAMEQTRLLERFKQMRLWQQQQQEMLMNQQQQQLMQLKKEQERVQGLISRQRDQQWGSGRPNTFDTSTPPRRQVPTGIDVVQVMADSSQTKGLPKPVIYIQPKEDDDEIKTNPDLFSDTNSNRGSQACVEDGMFPIPDSASEASVDVGDIHLRQQLKHQQQYNQHFQQRFNPHELDAPKKLHRSFAELETSEDFINQSYQSPTVFEKHQEKIIGKDDKAMSEICETEEVVEDEDDHSDEQSDDDDDESDEHDNDGESDESESEEESQDNTQIEVRQGTSSIDDVPIKPGVDGTKTFEQLLEEQLRAEEDRLQQQAASEKLSLKPKKTFLKKGEGIARFDSKSDQKSGRLRKHPKSLSTNQKSAGQVTNQKSGSGSSKSTTGIQKSCSGGGSSQTQKTSKNTAKPPTNQRSKAGSKPGVRTGAMIKSKKEGKGKSTDQKSPSKHKDGQSLNQGQGPGLKNKRADSIPDDASFIASLSERQKESEKDMEELDEFEILEHFADNMSFCSNSSIVTKGLKGLQNDRILAGKLPTQSVKVGSVSPRSALIKKLEAERLERLKKVTVIQTNDNTGMGDKQELNKKTNSYTANTNNNSNEELKKDQNDDDDDEYESVSDSSEDSSEDSSDDSNDDDDDGKTNKATSAVKINLDDPGNNRNLHRLSSVQNVHDSVKDASVLSTEKKLERALSYTGMTETSESRESESDRGIDSEEESETDGSEDDDEEKSLPKIVTRKVATKMLGSNHLSVPNVGDSADFFSGSFNSSSFAPKMKSPIVISKEKVSLSEFKSKPNFANIEDTKFSYHSDTDSVGNTKKDLSDIDDIDDPKASKSHVLSERKTLQFDDDDEWNDSSPQVNKKRLDSEGDTDHDKTLGEEIETQMAKLDINKVQTMETKDGDTPPTSKLVAKLFPKLKPQQKKQEEQDIKKVQTMSQAEVGDGVQSKVLRDKLTELEREIEKFRNENSYLTKLRAEREEGLAMLKKEITEFEKEKNEELKRLEEFKNEEMKKLKHERKVFEKYQKAARAGPDKKEREEIESLKTQVQELQEEMKKKESRWTSNNARLRGKIDHFEQENEELKEEIKLLEKKRLDWMQKDKGKGKSAGQIRSSTPTGEDMDDQIPNGHLQDQFNDMSMASSIKSNIFKPSQSQPKVNVHSSFPPGSKQATSQPSLGNQSTNHNKNNVNQSSKTSSVNSVKTVNQSKKASVQKTGTYLQGQNKLVAKPVGKSNSLPVKGGDKNILRNSLNEDLPRTATFAQHQDVSMYSEADGEMSVHMSTNLPRKLATKMGVDRSVIDKGNDTSYEETQHSDGKLERVYRNGAREILFSNGTRKEISSDGQSIVVSFFNGDVKQIMPDQRVIYYYAEAQTTVTSYPDGLEILQFPNNQTEKLYADGTREITFPDQTVKYIFPNGSEESIFQDGTIIRLEKNGDKIMEFPNGQREIHTQEYKKREYPDGTAKTVYPDGRQETRYSNGRLRVKDKEGNVIIDRLC